ncbi:MAG: cobalt ECF transporter T component CbiQ, partial [Bdellovibrionaceae bacterium]|nr:cobalt ECF transporter T component CbiQ [Pseudobdellovibrionaceae bacterium]
MSCRALLWSVQAALLLTATTHFTDVLFALRALRLPEVMVAILSFAYRYLFVMVDEAQRSSQEEGLTGKAST